MLIVLFIKLTTYLFIYLVFPLNLLIYYNNQIILLFMLMTVNRHKYIHILLINKYKHMIQLKDTYNERIHTDK